MLSRFISQTFGIGIVLFERFDFERHHGSIHGHFLDQFVGCTQQLAQCVFDSELALCSEKDSIGIATIFGNQSLPQSGSTASMESTVLIGSNDNDVGVLWVCIAPVFYSISVNVSNGIRWKDSLPRI